MPETEGSMHRPGDALRDTSATNPTSAAYISVSHQKDSSHRAGLRAQDRGFSSENPRVMSPSHVQNTVASDITGRRGLRSLPLRGQRRGCTDFPFHLAGLSARHPVRLEAEGTLGVLPVEVKLG